MTGHVSDAIDCYQITSDDQRQKLSSIIAGEHVSESSNSVKLVETVESVTECKEVEKIAENSELKVTCKCQKENYINVGSIVNEMISKNKKTGKTIIKLEIEISNE